MYSWKTVLVTIGLLFGLKIWNPMFIENISWSWFDYLHSTHSVEEYNPESGLPEIILVDIDEKSVEQHGQLPFPRKIYADKLLESHWSNTYVFTQVFSEPDRFGGDEEFATALVNRLSILSSAPTIQTEKGSSPFVGTSTLGSGDAKNAVWGTPGVLSPIPVLEGNTYGVGVTTATPSQSGTPNFDGTIRSAPLLMQANGQIYPSLAVEVLRAFNDEKSYQMKVTEEVGVEWVRVGRQKPISTTPQGDLMISYWNKFKRYSFTDELPENAILVFGVTAEGWNNPVSTPMGVMYPHEVQANLIQTALTGIQIKQSYFLEFVEIVLLLSVLLIVLVMVYKLPTALSGTFSLGLVVLQVGGSFYIWSSSLVLFDTFFSSLASLIVFGHASFNKYYVTFQEKQQIKKQFQKYLSPDMIEELQKDPSKLKLGGDRKEMTFMFMDIIGFTPISEHYMKQDDPEGLVELINKFLDMQTKIILNNGGTIDKYMGDCIMSFWNAPMECKDHADLAVKSALEVLEATKELNEELKPLELPPINVGIGVSTGQCIVGNMGSELRFDYSVIGDAVNLGARLEGQTRNYDGVDLLLSEGTYKQCKVGAYIEVDRILVKGKSEKVRIFTPIAGTYN
jgi:adenylate cyclase